MRCGGLDENGYGALAGPLVVTIYVTDAGVEPPCEVRDSKKVSPKDRKLLVKRLLKVCADVSIGRVEPHEINRHGIVWAWKRACKRAVRRLKKIPHYLYIDGDRPLPFKPQWMADSWTIPKADDDPRYWQVAAAANIGKLNRDEHMVEIAKQFKGYDWENNKGYGAPKHREALLALGPTPEHRTQYIQKILEGGE